MHASPSRAIPPSSHLLRPYCWWCQGNIISKLTVHTYKAEQSIFTVSFTIVPLCVLRQENSISITWRGSPTNTYQYRWRCSPVHRWRCSPVHRWRCSPVHRGATHQYIDGATHQNIDGAAHQYIVRWRGSPVYRWRGSSPVTTCSVTHQ